MVIRDGYKEIRLKFWEFPESLDELAKLMTGSVKMSDEYYKTLTFEEESDDDFAYYFPVRGMSLKEIIRTVSCYSQAMENFDDWEAAMYEYVNSILTSCDGNYCKAYRKAAEADVDFWYGTLEEIGQKMFEDRLCDFVEDDHSYAELYNLAELYFDFAKYAKDNLKKQKSYKIGDEGYVVVNTD